MLGAFCFDIKRKQYFGSFFCSQYVTMCFGTGVDFYQPVLKALQGIGDEADKFGTQLDRALKFSDYGALLKLCPCVDQECRFYELKKAQAKIMRTFPSS